MPDGLNRAAVRHGTRRVSLTVCQRYGPVRNAEQTEPEALVQVHACRDEHEDRRDGNLQMSHKLGLLSTLG